MDFVLEMMDLCLTGLVGSPAVAAGASPVKPVEIAWGGPTKDCVRERSPAGSHHFQYKIHHFQYKIHHFQ